MGRFEKRLKGMELRSSFLSCEKDTETIVRQLFLDNGLMSEELKRLMVINTKDCLDDRTNPIYQQALDNISIADLRDHGYIRFAPKLQLDENDEVKTYLLITFDNFMPHPENDYYRDCTIMIDIICHIDAWDIGNYRQRPLKIAGYIDGILNKSRLSGLGTLTFMGCNEIVLSEEFAGYCLIYSAVHGDDDNIESEDD